MWWPPLSWSLNQWENLTQISPTCTRLATDQHGLRFIGGTYPSPQDVSSAEMIVKQTTGRQLGDDGHGFRVNQHPIGHQTTLDQHRTWFFPSPPRWNTALTHWDWWPTWDLHTILGHLNLKIRNLLHLPSSRSTCRVVFHGFPICFSKRLLEGKNHATINTYMWHVVNSLSKTATHQSSRSLERAGAALVESPHQWGNLFTIGKPCETF